jgi:proteasome accessory factor C
MTQMTSLERIKRLLAVLPWIENQNGPYIEEVVTRFNYPRKELIEDLENVVFFVGVYPFTPDCLIEVSITEEKVWVRYADWFRQPMKLDKRELTSLRAAGEALIEFSGFLKDDIEEELGPLERALTKLSAFEDGSDNLLKIKLTTPTSHLLEMQNSIKDGTVIQIEYLVGSRNEISSRKIEPEKIFADGGKWYVQAFCKLSLASRTFRLDRIRDIKILDEIRETQSSTDLMDKDFFNLDKFPSVIIEIPVKDKALIDGFPNIEVEEISGEKLRLFCPVASEAWLKHLLMVLGINAQLVEIPAEIEDNVRSKAAKEILKLYTS